MNVTSKQYVFEWSKNYTKSLQVNYVKLYLKQALC